MKKATKIIIGLLCTIVLTAILVSATEFTPQGNINLRGIYSVTNATSITSTNLSGNLNWNNLTKSKTCTNGIWINLKQYAKDNNLDINILLNSEITEDVQIQYTCDQIKCERTKTFK
jgi:hypothetical protein